MPCVLLDRVSFLDGALIELYVTPHFVCIKQSYVELVGILKDKLFMSFIFTLLFLFFLIYFLPFI